MPSTLPVEVQAGIERLLRAGASDVAVAAELGVDRATAGRYRRRFGVPGFRARGDCASCRFGHSYPEHAGRTREGWQYCRECVRLRDAERSRRRYVPRPSVGGRPVWVRRWVPVEPDWVAIERAVAGDPPERLTPRERAAAIGRLSRSDYSAAEIADRVRCHVRTVYRVTTGRSPA